MLHMSLTITSAQLSLLTLLSAHIPGKCQTGASAGPWSLAQLSARLTGPASPHQPLTLSWPGPTKTPWCPDFSALDHQDTQPVTSWSHISLTHAAAPGTGHCSIITPLSPHLMMLTSGTAAKQRPEISRMSLCLASHLLPLIAALSPDTMVSLVLTQGRFWLQWWAYFKYLINQLDAKSEAVLGLRTLASDVACGCYLTDLYWRL